MDGPRGIKTAVVAPRGVVPDDALVEMFRLLPARSLHRFKCVSRSWCGLVTDPLHRELLAQTLVGFLHADVDDDTAAQSESFLGGGVGDGCRDGEDGDQGVGGGDDDRSDLRMCLSKRRVTRRFINVSGMAEPLVDPSFPFLPPPPPPGHGEEEELFRDVILDSRDGLLLLGRFRRHEAPGCLHSPLCYLVCNPATAESAAVPGSGWAPTNSQQLVRTYLLFDAATGACQFHLLQFWVDALDTVRAIHTYSSEAKAWTDRHLAWLDGGWRDWGLAVAPIQPDTGSAVVGGALHLVVDTDCTAGPNNLVAVDEAGNTRRTIALPRPGGAGEEKTWYSVFVARSQDRIHYIMCARPRQRRLSREEPLKLLIWVLEDYDAGKWVMKHAVTFPELFGRVACLFRVEYTAVAVHPDGDRVFFVRHWDRKMVAYDMGSREVRVVCDLGSGGDCGEELPTPYVPLYSKSSALANKQ